jgi:hypothetical protein
MFLLQQLSQKKYTRFLMKKNTVITLKLIICDC